MSKQNCWEHKKCGREANGAKVHELGVCPASTEFRVTGANGGKNAGRACWAIAGTLCGGKQQGTFAMKNASCMVCDFYKIVSKEEGTEYKNSSYIISKINSK